MFGFGGSSQETLVRSLKREGIIKNQRVEQSVLFVDRRHFCSHTPFPYADQPQGIGHGATISAPHMHAYALETLKDHLFEGAHALDVGSGSGYLVACIAQMVGETGLVVGIDHIPELVELSVANLKSDPKLAALLQGSSASARSSASTAADATQTQNRSPSWSASGPHPHARGSAEVGAGFDSARLRLVCGDGRRGFPEEAPYDAIHVGAAAPSIPEELIGQLRPGGRLVCPVGAAGKSQQMYAIDRDPRDTFGSTSTPRYTKRAMFGVSYVPLTDANKQTCR